MCQVTVNVAVAGDVHHHKIGGTVLFSANCKHTQLLPLSFSRVHGIVLRSSKILKETLEIARTVGAVIHTLLGADQ